MRTDNPASLPVALAGFLSTGVAWAALFLPFLADPTAQALTIAFGNAAIALGVAVFLNRSTTSSTAPVLDEGTPVAVTGTDDVVIVQPTPPGPVGIEDGAPSLEG